MDELSCRPALDDWAGRIDGTKIHVEKPGAYSHAFSPANVNFFLPALSSLAVDGE